MVRTPGRRHLRQVNQVGSLGKWGPYLEPHEMMNRESCIISVILLPKMHYLRPIR